MKLQAKRNWLKSADVKSGDSLTLTSEGEIVPSATYTYDDGTPKKDLVVKATHNGVEVDFTVNATNKKTLIAAFGDETSAWVGKVVKLDVANVLIAGKTKKSIVIQAGEVKNLDYTA